MAFDRVCALRPGSGAARQAELDRRLLMRNLRCVLVPRSVWDQEVAEAFKKLEDVRRESLKCPKSVTGANDELTATCLG